MASYLLITSLYDEEENVNGLFDSVESQKQPPGLWLIIDDGSKDGTYDRVVDRIQRTTIRTVAWRGERKPAPNYDTIGRAIRRALLSIGKEEYESFNYYCLLGADSRVEPHYFSELIGRMEEDQKLGMASGVIVTSSGKEETRSDIPRGSGSSTRACIWRSLDREDLPDFDIDAFYTAKARIRGYKTKMFHDLEVYQNRPTTSVIEPYRKGRLMAIHWYNPAIVVAHALRVLLRGGNPLPIIRGYAEGLRGNRIEDDDVKKYFGRRILMDILRSSLVR